MLLAMLGGVVLYAGGQRLADRVQRRRWVVGLLLVLLCLPGLSFVLYYAHLFPEPWWYIEWRSLPGTEALSASWCLLGGFLMPRAVAAPSFAAQIWRGLLFTLMTVFLLAPFAKPIIRPVELSTPLQNEWSDGVCLQTTASTCGPASLATILAYYGQPHSEREIARACYSCASGTELWYLLRFARRQGLRASYRQPRSVADIPAPALLGTGLGNAGHFITVLGQTREGVVIGDPLSGKKTLTAAQLATEYRVCGAIVFRP
jgi:predicted double-glycine peptidase